MEAFGRSIFVHSCVGRSVQLQEPGREQPLQTQSIKAFKAPQQLQEARQHVIVYYKSTNACVDTCAAARLAQDPFFCFL